MKTKRSFTIVSFLTALVLWAAGTVLATSNYEYGANEYVTISEGASPDGRIAVAAHGEGELGEDNFHLYLFDALAGKKIGPLEEIAEVLDTGAEAYGAKWKPDSSEVTIVYRNDRHAPLKAMTYRLAKGRAIPATRRPVNLRDSDPLVRFWQEHCAGPSSKPGRTFGTPKQ